MISFLKRNRRLRNDQEGQPQVRRRIDLGEDDPIYAIYVVGDVHGCISLLRSAEEAIKTDVKRRGLPGLMILLGDYVDRGPDSAAVMEHLLSPMSRSLRRMTLCGNHDEMFLKFLMNPAANLSWLKMGGVETLSSYGITGSQRWPEESVDFAHVRETLGTHIPERHIELLKNMPVCARVGRYVFAHAGVRPGIPLDQQKEADMMWIREPFLSSGPQLPFVVIHGHTPSTEPVVGPSRIGIDTGAYVTGRLCVLRLSGLEHEFIL